MFTESYFKLVSRWWTMWKYTFHRRTVCFEAPPRCNQVFSMAKTFSLEMGKILSNDKTTGTFYISWEHSAEWTTESLSWCIRGRIKRKSILIFLRVYKRNNFLNLKSGKTILTLAKLQVRSNQCASPSIDHRKFPSAGSPIQSKKQALFSVYPYFEHEMFPNVSDLFPNYTLRRYSSERERKTKILMTNSTSTCSLDCKIFAWS